MIVKTIKTEGVAVDKKGTKGNRMIFGKKTLSKLLNRYIDPLLDKINLTLKPLDYSLKYCSDLDFQYSGISKYCSTIADTTKLVASLSNAEFDRGVIADLDLIRLLMISLHSVISKKGYLKCGCCYRRILSHKYCRYHSSSHSDFYMLSKRLSNYQDNGLSESIKKWQDKRAILGDFVEVFSLRTLTNNTVLPKEFNSHTPAVEVDFEIFIILMKISKWPWEVASDYIEHWITNLPEVCKIISGASKKVSSFKEYVRLVYSKEYLDNEYEHSTSAMWFYTTLLEAQSWLNAENESNRDSDKRYKDNSDRDNIIFTLVKQGLSIRNISERVGLGKSRVHKIIELGNESFQDLDSDS
jgi:hypothetical protein